VTFTLPSGCAAATSTGERERSPLPPAPTPAGGRRKPPGLHPRIRASRVESPARERNSHLSRLARSRHDRPATPEVAGRVPSLPSFRHRSSGGLCWRPRKNGLNASFGRTATMRPSSSQTRSKIRWSGSPLGVVFLDPPEDAEVVERTCQFDVGRRLGCERRQFFLNRSREAAKGHPRALAQTNRSLPDQFPTAGSGMISRNS
jgi:hypothetical protein